MPPAVQNTACRVFIQPPSARALAFRPEDLAPALLAVETEKDLAAACGSFTLTFTAEVDASGRRWDQRIPRRSLVFVTMDRPAATHLPVAEPTVMLGLTDDHSVQEDYSEAHPRRIVRIHGREISCVLVDAMLWFHAMLAHDPTTGTLTVTTSQMGEQRLALTQNPHLARVYEDPRAILSRILDYYLFVGGEALSGPAQSGDVVQAPVINLDFPIALTSILEKNQQAWRTFEPVRVPIPQHPSNAGSLWNYLHLYIDRAFQEFFTRIEDGTCKIHFRGKPFRHALNDVSGGTRFKSAEEEPTLQTLTLEPADLLAQHLQVQTAHVYNVFCVLPRGMSDNRLDPWFKQRVMPQIIVDHTHPSFVGRYGLRVLEVESPYLSPLADEAGLLTPMVQSLRPDPPNAANYAHLANQLAYEEGIPDALRPWFVALIKNESNFDPTAHGPVLRSQNQAQGIAQWVAPYPAGVGLTDPFDPFNALQAAARYWQQMRAMPWIGDDPVLLVAGYNAGPTAVRTYGGVPPFAETQKLVRKVEADAPRYADLVGTAAAAVRPSPQPQQRSATPQTENTVIATAQRWASILRCWYDMGGELFSGLLTVRGHPAWNVGHRLVGRDGRGPWEAYIEGVRHVYEMRTGQYLSHLRITRGWYLNDAITLQLYEEGRTNVTATRGGPPTLDPITGQPIGTGQGDVEVIIHGTLP